MNVLGHKNPDAKAKYYFFALLPVVFIAYYYYGMRPVWMCAWSVLLCMALDMVCLKLRGKPVYLPTSAAITGVIVVMLMPASVELWLVALIDVISIVLGKHVFGGQKYCIFHPACVGLAFIAVVRPAQMFLYPAPGTALPLTGAVPNSLLSVSPYGIMMNGGKPAITDIDLLLGNFTGPAGAHHIIVLATCALFLLVVKSASKAVVFTSMGTFLTLFYLFPRIPTSRFTSAALETGVGMFLFLVVFMAGERYKAPKSIRGRILYGFCFGALSFLYRRIGKTECGEIFALLLCDAMALHFDAWTYKAKLLYQSYQRKVLGSSKERVDVLKDESTVQDVTEVEGRA